MAAKKNSIIPALLIPIPFSWRVNGVTYSESWGVTQFEESNLKYAWMINNFKSITLKNLSDPIYSPDFWPSGNESFKWHLKLNPQSSSVKGETSYTFKGITGLGWETFIERNKAFNSCQSNGTLKNAPNVIQSTGYKNLERSKPSLMYEAFRTLVQEYRLGIQAP
ncbi:uncharacterized protein LOC116417555 [Nasonia vitripennis]|uniref:Uncharacterized protein n=1 Tax=Nasonia vitripennis TaxID=7425 RepID=A0A7M7QG20_NASVI|nr:uncharacterized protein LOC116417555 [Nasonia vitripennis]